MECKLCGRERPVRSFSRPKMQICNSCEATLGYDRQKVRAELEGEIGEVVEGRLRSVVQQELPRALLDIITEKHNEIDVTLRVI